MNYFEIESKLLSGEKIFNIPLKVCFYARVSTDSDNQLNSLENQLNYYENYIKSKQQWIYYGGYIDEGVSGVRVEKRDGFKKMIQDAKMHKFDLIITKEVSRFARDLEDSIHYIRELKNSNVGIFFENQNLNTFDSNSELILNIMFNIAQDESKKLSSRVKFGHRQAIQKGHVLGSSNITGYKKNNCKLEIVPEESNFIKKVFELYATGKYGLYKLSKELAKFGYYNKNGHLFDKDSLKKMIMNPKYKGFYRAHTYEIIDYRTKKRKTIPQEEQIVYKCEDGSIPSIISEELWNKANQVLQVRSESYVKNNKWSGGCKYPFSSKIYCKEHNTNFQRSHGSRSKNRPVWTCNAYQKFKIEKCVSPIMAEKDLLNIMNDIMNMLIPKKNIIINNLLDLYIKVDKKNNYEKELHLIEEETNNIELKKSKALDLVLKGLIEEEDLKYQFKKFKNIINNLNVKKQDIINTMEKNKNNNLKLSIISKAIEEEIAFGLLEDFIRKFVTEIIVSKNKTDRYDITLDIYLNINGEMKPKIKGAWHIKGPLENDILYLQNQKCNTIEHKRNRDNPNKFTYNVYLETL